MFESERQRPLQACVCNWLRAQYTDTLLCHRLPASCMLCDLSSPAVCQVGCCCFCRAGAAALPGGHTAFRATRETAAGVEQAVHPHTHRACHLWRRADSNWVQCCWDGAVGLTLAGACWLVVLCWVLCCVVSQMSSCVSGLLLPVMLCYVPSTQQVPQTSSFNAGRHVGVVRPLLLLHCKRCGAKPSPACVCTLDACAARYQRR